MIRTCIIALSAAAFSQVASAQQACMPTKRLGTELTGVLTVTPAAGGVRNDFRLKLANPICVAGKGEDGVDRKEADLTIVILAPATVGAREDLPNFADREMTVSGEFKFMDPASPVAFFVTRPRWPTAPK